MIKNDDKKEIHTKVVIGAVSTAPKKAEKKIFIVKNVFLKSCSDVHRSKKKEKKIFNVTILSHGMAQFTPSVK